MKPFKPGRYLPSVHVGGLVLMFAGAGTLLTPRSWHPHPLSLAAFTLGIAAIVASKWRLSPVALLVLQPAIGLTVLVPRVRALGTLYETTKVAFFAGYFAFMVVLLYVSFSPRFSVQPEGMSRN